VAVKIETYVKALAQHPTHGTPDEVQAFDYIYDQRHYQRILKILAETDRIMATITMTL
jgi:hypothetical protein